MYLKKKQQQNSENRKENANLKERRRGGSEKERVHLRVHLKLTSLNEGQLVNHHTRWGVNQEAIFKLKLTHYKNKSQNKM